MSVKCVITLLGTGTSQGVPVIGCCCPVCRSTDPRDSRLRTSAMVEVGEHKFIIDEYAEGYIDHQSHEDYSSIPDFLMQNDTDIIDFVYGSVIVNTDNDNH